MKINIVGCPDKERFRPYIKRATVFYANQLFSKKLKENLQVKIKFDKNLKTWGEAEVEGHNDSNKPREFNITINPGIGARCILETLAHEMVHIKQYALMEINESLTRWRGTVVPEETDYWFQPWEVEAHGLEGGLFTLFAMEEKLWDVFDNVKNPETVIEDIPLGWKEFA